MKRLCVVSRAASPYRSCCPQRARAIDRSWRAISTSQPHRQSSSDDSKPSSRSRKSDFFLPDGELNPKYYDPRTKTKSLPEGWKQVVTLTEANELDEAADSDTVADSHYMDQAMAEADAEIDGFNHPGGTNVWGLTPEEAREMERSPELRQEKYEPGLFAQEEEKDDPGEETEFDADDFTADGHRELEQHRELREFARVMAWDMPLLWHHRKDFEPPTAATPLRFRYTTYMGEEHPASRKVVVDFSPAQLPDLAPVQLSKFIKLLGPRYNPSTETARMSCEMFPSAAQNKRYLGDMVEKLLVEARDGTDTFEDVPFDFRHHKPKTRPQFPEAWKMTDARRAELAARRRETAQLEAREMQAGRLVDGNARVERLVARRAEQEPVPVMVPAGNDKGKGGRRALT